MGLIGLEQAVCVTRFDQSECAICGVILALEKMVFRVVCLSIFAFFQSCGLIFETIPRRKVVRRHCVDTCDVTFENLAFLCNCEEFEVAGHV